MPALTLTPSPPPSPSLTTPTPSILSRTSASGSAPHRMGRIGGASEGRAGGGGAGAVGSGMGSGRAGRGAGVRRWSGRSDDGDGDVDGREDFSALDGGGVYNDDTHLDPTGGLLRPAHAHGASASRRHSHRAIREAQEGKPARTWGERAVDGARALGRTGRGWVVRYRKASRAGKATIWLILTINLALILAVLIITPHRIGLFLTRLSHRLRTLGPGGAGGMALLGGAVVLASHPPLFGFGGSMTMIGFTFGVWPGMVVASVANMLGAALAFVSIRTFFLAWMRSFGASRSTKWSAFAHVVAARGTWLIVMIRWCPLPWAIGNGLFASIESVSFSSFMLANLLVQPRLLVPVFIGSRLSSLTGGDADAPPDPVKKWVNIASILIGLSVSFTTGWFIYRQTLRKMAELDPSVSVDDEDEAVDILERNALLGDYSGESEDEGEAVRREGR